VRSIAEIVRKQGDQQSLTNAASLARIADSLQASIAKNERFFVDDIGNRSADSDYLEIRYAPLPSGYASAVIPLKMWVGRPRANGQYYQPDIEVADLDWSTSAFLRRIQRDIRQESVVYTTHLCMAATAIWGSRCRQTSRDYSVVIPRENEAEASASDAKAPGTTDTVDQDHMGTQFKVCFRTPPLPFRYRVGSIFDR
jgi:hypothetical protein